MIYRISDATARPDHTVIVTWADGVEAVVDLAPVLAKGSVFAAMRDPNYFMHHMRVAEDRLGVEWPGGVDFSADGLRFMAFPDEAAEEFRSVSAAADSSASAPAA